RTASGSVGSASRGRRGRGASGAEGAGRNSTAVAWPVSAASVHSASAPSMTTRHSAGQCSSAERAAIQALRICAREDSRSCIEAEPSPVGLRGDEREAGAVPDAGGGLDRCAERERRNGTAQRRPRTVRRAPPRAAGGIGANSAGGQKQRSLDPPRRYKN